MLVMDGCDAAICGYVETGAGALAVYNYNELVAVFERQGMDRDGAVEWIDYNILGAYMGPSTPLVMYPGDRADLDARADLETESDGSDT